MTSAAASSKVYVSLLLSHCLLLLPLFVVGLCKVLVLLCILSFYFCNNLFLLRMR